MRYTSNARRGACLLAVMHLVSLRGFAECKDEKGCMLAKLQRAVIVRVADREDPELTALVTGIITKEFLGEIVEAYEEVRRPDTGSARALDYFVFSPGTRRTYKDFSTDEVFTMSTETGVHRDHPVYLQTRTRSDGREDIELVEILDDGLKHHFNRFRSIDLEMDPPVRLTGPELTVGDAFTTVPARTNPATGNTSTWISTVEGFETVKTQAGSFECVKIKLLVMDSKLGTKLADLISWYGKGPQGGLVKRRGQFFGVFLNEELVPGRRPGS